MNRFRLGNSLSPAIPAGEEKPFSHRDKGTLEAEQ